MNSYIFPGGCLPLLAVILRVLAKRTDLQAAGFEELTPHYVETLRRWRANFTANRSALADLLRRAIQSNLDALARLL